MVASSLPSKEQSTFKNILKYYETKQYKKALKCAESILKKFPNHGETLALKGLVIAALNRKEEAYELVRRGLKNDLKSHICWHVYGLLYRGDQDYKEAAKAYLQALKFDPENIQILRDLALLQVQTRDYDGLMLTRRKLVTIKPGIRNHWLGFAVACHLKGEMDIAIKILESYEGTLGKNSDSLDASSDKRKEGSNQEAKIAQMEEAYETSETLLYHAMILQEMGAWKASLDYLEKNKGRIIDLLSYLEFRANLLVQLLLSKSISTEEFEHLYSGEPETAILQLLDLNPNNLEYIRLYMVVYSFRSDKFLNNGVSSFCLESNISLEACNELQQRYPHSSSLERLTLEVAIGEEFLRRVKEYFSRFLYQGVPSLMTDCKSLYRNDTKVNMIEQVLNEFYHEGLNNFISKSKDLTPDAVLWSLYFLAQHFDMKADTEQALVCVNKAIEHTPTLIEAYSVKSKIFKHAGGIFQSLQFANEARKLDLADRYLNCQCIQLALRLDMIPLAEAWMSLFTKEEGVKESQNIYDLQVIWYELESAESHFRLKEFSKALKLFKAVERHFQDIIEDQFDFHSYCLRKATLRAYIRVLRLEDKLFGQKYYLRNAKGLVRLYLEIFELQKQKSNNEEHLSLSDLSLSEEKKGQKSKKIHKDNNDKSKNSPAGKEGNAHGVKSTSSSTGSGWMEIDPNGETLYESIRDPLYEANKYISILERYVGDEMAVQTLAFELALKEEKLVLILKAVVHMERIVLNMNKVSSPSNDDFYIFVVKKLHFAYFLEERCSYLEQLPISIISFVKDECHRLCEGSTFEKLLMYYWDMYQESLAFRVHLAELLKHLDMQERYPFVIENLSVICFSCHCLFVGFRNKRKERYSKIVKASLCFIFKSL
ncbi:N-alpha-acetyltransferase 15, NatA auxiliary subunit [Galdieria sulphuraria]|nr:N-alpha-acetyltransferase 15, NatA auxiliary subunit [Galdieria sulphuraria]